MVPKLQPILTVSHLTTSFIANGVWRPVVKDISFTVGAAETVAIVGESGSGKSVTAFSIMRLLQKDRSRIEGDIVLGGRNISRCSERNMLAVRGNDVSMIFQEPMTSLNPLFTIGNQISETLLCHTGMTRHDARLETIRLLEKVRIPHAASRFDEYPHRFSGGMRQRVMIAMALASRPKLLIADEPTTALDVTVQKQILELMQALQEEEGTSILFITHDMGVVAEIAARTIVMYRGKIVETDTTDTIFHHGKHPYTRALLAAVPVLGAMQGRKRPLRFPVADHATGLADEQREAADTVDTTAPPILKVENMVKCFDVSKKSLFSRDKEYVHAVNNVSFTLQPGETLALVGESGCGKSTTGRTVMRLIEPDGGRIELAGRDVSRLDRQGMRFMRQTLQMIFQDPYASLNPRMTVGQAVAEPFLEHGLGSRTEAKDRVACMLEQVGLTAQMASRYPHEFSGGQRQRVCIARALILEPKLIIADESVSALDVSIKAQVINLLLDLQEKFNLAYLFISHDMSVVERVSHRVAVMYMGSIVETGSRTDVFDNPCHAYTQKLIAAVPIPDPRLRRSRSGLMEEAIIGPVRSCDKVGTPVAYEEVSTGHFIRIET